MNPTEQPEPTPAPEQQAAPAPPPQPAQPQGERRPPRPGPGQGKGGPGGPGGPGGFRGKPRPPRDKQPVREVINIYDFGQAAPKLKDLDASIADEIEAAMAGFESKELLVEPPRSKRPAGAGTEQGRKKGTVLSIRGGDVFMDVPGGRCQGVLSMLQFPDGPPEIGSEVDISIEGYDRQNGLLILTRQGAAVVANWSTVAEGMTVEARVTETNKGGLAVEVNGIRGFMPISQIDLFRIENAEQFVNQKLLCLVTEVNPEERNLVVSRRALLEKEREHLREKFWAEVAEGQVLEGIVRSLQPFGAFIDLGGGDGLLHVSELAWSRVKDPSEVLQLGQRVRVIVLRLDREARKLSLSLRQLTEGPWDSAHLNYPPGSIVTGKVTRIQDFGAFVEVEPGIEGLVHISELSGQRVHRVRDVVQEDQQIQVKVLDVDREQRRMSLSLKAAVDAAKPETPEEPEEPESGEPAKPKRERTIPLRGGIGTK